VTEFVAKMNQILFLLGVSHRPWYGSLEPCPKYPRCIRAGSRQG